MAVSEAEARGVLVVAELADGSLSTPTLELLGLGRKLADDLKEELALLLLGSGIGHLAAEAMAYGADRVYLVDHPLLQEPLPDPYVAAAAQACREVRPNLVLISRTLLGRDLGPRLAFRLGVGLAQDVLEVRVDPERKQMIAERPVYGGNAMARVSLLTRPQIATIRPKAYEVPPRQDGRQGEVIELALSLDPSAIQARVVDRVKEETHGIKLEEARVVVAGGRGLGGAEPFRQLEELARLLGGAVGASRAACDAGWVDHAYQIGLTGKNITPDLYIAVGISGASQHMAGCSGAKVIVAINKDPEANIFKEARYGVVGDWRKVLPAFLEQVRQLTG